jgi:hypothetical protein
MVALVAVVLVTLAPVLATSGPASGATPPPSACRLLTARTAARSLGGPVDSPLGNTPAFCAYARRRHPTVLVSITLITGTAEVADTLHEIDRRPNAKVDRERALWYETPSHLLGGEKGGTLTVGRHGLVVFMALRGTRHPEQAALLAMSLLLRRL